MAGSRRPWRWAQRLLRVVVFLVLALLLLAVSAYLLRGPLFGRLIAERIERELAVQLGGRYAIERIEGSYVFDLAVVGLRTVEPPPGRLRRLDCARAVVEYDLRRLLDGDLGAIESVLTSGAVVEIDLARPGGAAEDMELPARLPRLELYGSVTVSTGIGEVRAEGLAVNTAGTEKLGVRATELRLPARFGPGAPFAGMLERTGPLAFVLTSDTPVAGIVPVRAAWDGTLDAQLVVGGSAAVLRVAGGEATLSSGALDLERLPAWVYPEGIEPPEAVASVEARATLDPIAVEAALSAPSLRWRDLDIRDVRIDARHAGGTTLLRSAHAEGRGLLVDAKDVALDPALPWFVGDVGEANVRVADLRAFEPRLDRALMLALTARRTAGGGFVIDAVRLEGEGILLEGRGEVVPPDDPARWRDARVSGGIAGTVRDLAAGGRGFEGEVRLEGEVLGTLAAPEVTATAEARGLVVEGRTLDRATLRCRLSPPVLRLDAVRIEAEAGTLEARATVDLLERTVADGSYEIDVVDVEAFLRLFPGAPSAEGTLSGRGTFAVDAGGARGTAEISAAGVVVREQEIGTLSVRARADAREIAIDFAEARGAWGSAGGRGAVRLDEARGSVEALDVDAGALKATLVRPLRVTWGPEGTVAAPLEFTALGGRVEGVVSLKGGERLGATLRGEGIDLSLLDARLAGRATADLAIDGERYEIDLSASGATYEGRAADVRLKVRSGLDGIVVERLRIQGGERFVVEGTAKLPWRFDGRALERVETVQPEVVIDARMNDLSLGGIAVGGAVVSVRGEGHGLRSTARLRDLSFRGFPVRGEAWVEANVTPGRVEATAVLERCDLGEAEARAATDRSFDWTRPGEIGRALEAAQIEGAIGLRAPDLATFRRLVPGLAELTGTADAKIVLSGSLRSPSIAAEVHLAGVGVKVEGDVPRFTECRADLRFDGRTVRVESLAGELGHAPVEAAGTIDFGGAGGPTMDLRFKGTNALLVADPRLRVRADLDVSLSGAFGAPSLGGRVTITDALYTRASNAVARGRGTVSDSMARISIRRAPLASAAFDLQVTADETIRLRAPDLRGNLSCDLRIRGTGEAPALEGRVFFRDLLVKVQDVAALKVDRGEVRFPQGEPFDPRIDATAHTRLKGYEIEVEVMGRVDDAALRVSSRPDLPQEDAILLLVTGYTREELEREGISRVAFEKLAAFLGGRLVSRISGPGDPDERAFLDRLQIQVGKEVSRSGEDTIEAEFEASDRIFLRVERDRFDEYNGSFVWRIRFR